MGEIDTDGAIGSYDVPGVFEMPFLAQRLAETGRYDAVICAALVVDSGIYRHYFVAQTVVSGLMEAGLKTGVLVMPVSLTPLLFQLTPEYQTFFHAHFIKMGSQTAAELFRLQAVR
ncbi:6,7-dimethyl-8-ribityllumazine synthase [Tritonibacter litoralis]|uniref:6,7-dimethyl-8-ribityllumazine synthase n=1 Tax=Tritonibacter litoralis TaxID=2662264 RepID=UPI0031B58A28